MENRTNLLDLIKSKANQHGVNWKLLDAIICQESGYRQWAVRFEPTIIKYELPKTHAKYNIISVETEQVAQATSYGLMQLLGRTARGMGFDGLLPSLFDIESNLDWGCQYLESQQRRYIDLKDVISSYNAGSAIKINGGMYKNQKYVNGVLKFMSA